MVETGESLRPGWLVGRWKLQQLAAIALGTLNPSRMSKVARELTGRPGRRAATNAAEPTGRTGDQAV